MSTFFRQFRTISSLKKNYDSGVISFYKVAAPALSLNQAVRKMHAVSIDRNLQLNSVGEIQNASSGKKPLAVILAWLNAKQTHIKKYRNLYISRGFDVLTVTMGPKDILFHVSGSQVIAKNVLDYLVSDLNYKDVIVHAFSAGGYFMGEMFIQMRKDAEKYKDITSRIRGVILDSFVDFEDIIAGISSAFTQNPIALKVFEWYVSAHLALMFNVATKHYVTVYKNFYNTPLKCPAIFLVSEADKMGNPAYSQMVMENWQMRGADVKMKCWKDSKHVCHLYVYQDEYIAEVDKFLSKVNLHSRKL